MTTPIPFPDIDPNKRIEGFQFNMLPGDFVQVAHRDFEHESLDVVVTTFFLDAAKNTVEYVGLIRQLLKPKGLWINLGSLSYSQDSDQLNLPLDLLKSVIKETGFTFVKDNIVICNYGQNSKHSMTDIQLHCPAFTCRKT